QHQDVALGASGREPVAGARARTDRNAERAVGVADELLAGEAAAIERVGNEPAVRIIERDREEARLRRGPGNREIASPVERAAAVVGGGAEHDAVAESQWKGAGALHLGAGIGVDLRG